jgi:hypothetical protein
MFPKDLESLKNLGSILTVPFFSVAFLVFADTPIPTQSNILSWFVWILIVVLVVHLVWALVEAIIAWVCQRSWGKIIAVWFGLSFLTTGLSAFPFFIQKAELPLNICWYLGFLGAGFRTFSLKETAQEEEKEFKDIQLDKKYQNRMMEAYESKHYTNPIS